MPPQPRTARQMRLGGELKKLREERRMTQKQVVNSFQPAWPTSKISRIESGQVSITDEDLAALLDLYGLGSAQRAAMMELAAGAQRRGWYASYQDVFKGPFPGLLDEASEILWYEDNHVPGMLQTQAYMRSLMSESPSAEDPGFSIDRRVQARLAQQSILSRPNPPTIEYIIGEPALSWLVGGPQVMREQLLTIWEVAQATRRVRVLPFSAGAHAGLNGPLQVFRFGEDHEIAYTEGHAGGVYLESASELLAINERWEDLQGKALPPQASAEFLARAADRLKE